AARSGGAPPGDVAELPRRRLAARPEPRPDPGGERRRADRRRAAVRPPLPGVGPDDPASGGGPRVTSRGGTHAGRALCGHRPRALVVGGRAAPGRADEARPSPPPVPREVHPAARRGLSRPVL